MAKIYELLKQKEEIEKEIKKEQNKEFKLTEKDLQVLTHVIGEVVIPGFLDTVVPPKLKTKIDGVFLEEENKGVITLVNLNTKKEYLTITIKGE